MKSVILTQEQKLKEAKKLTLMDDKFMSVALNDISACQHVLRILTGKKDLKVLHVKTQYTISKTASHESRLDVLAEDSQHKLYNIEIQRADTIDHARRTRFYCAMIDGEYLAKGVSYDKLPDVYIFYISETDIWGGERTVYEVQKIMDGPMLDNSYDDGLHVIYVNTAVDDGSETAKLMEYFKSAEPDDTSQGELSKRVHFLKSEAKGGKVMSEAAKNLVYSGKVIGKAMSVMAAMTNFHLSIEDAMRGLNIPESDWADYIEIIDYIKNNPEEFE